MAAHVTKLLNNLPLGMAYCVRTGGIQSLWFNVESGARQGCVLALDSYATGMEWLLERTVGLGAASVSFGTNTNTK